MASKLTQSTRLNCRRCAVSSAVAAARCSASSTQTTRRMGTTSSCRSLAADEPESSLCESERLDKHVTRGQQILLATDQAAPQRTRAERGTRHRRRARRAARWCRRRHSSIQDVGQMAVVLRGQVTHTRAKAPSCAKRAGTPGLVVMWVRLSQQRVHGRFGSGRPSIGPGRRRAASGGGPGFRSVESGCGP